MEKACKILVMRVPSLGISHLPTSLRSASTIFIPVNPMVFMNSVAMSLWNHEFSPRTTPIDLRLSALQFRRNSASSLAVGGVHPRAMKKLKPLRGSELNSCTHCEIMSLEGDWYSWWLITVDPVPQLRGWAIEVFSSSSGVLLSFLRACMTLASSRVDRSTCFLVVQCSSSECLQCVWKVCCVESFPARSQGVSPRRFARV